jgi:hypothetical protein
VFFTNKRTHGKTYKRHAGIPLHLTTNKFSFLEKALIWRAGNNSFLDSSHILLIQARRFVGEEHQQRRMSRSQAEARRGRQVSRPPEKREVTEKSVDISDVRDRHHYNPRPCCVFFTNKRTHGKTCKRQPGIPLHLITNKFSFLESA